MTRIAIQTRIAASPRSATTLAWSTARVRMEEDTITIDQKSKKPLISEELCSGCGICTNRVPSGR